MERLDLVHAIVHKKTKPVVSDDPYQRPITLFYPGIRRQPFFERAEFEWTGRLAAALEATRREIADVLRRREGFEPVFPGYADTGSWAAMWFYLYGQRYDRNCALAPHTARLFDTIPNLAGWGCFSAMAPGSHIKAHCGITNAKVRLHFAVQAEAHAGSRMRVGNRMYEWNEGDILIFDDSYEHEVWVSGRAPRIVLILDVYHPDLTPAEVDFMRALETTPTPLLPNGLRTKYQKIMHATRAGVHAPLDWLYAPRASSTAE